MSDDEVFISLTKVFPVVLEAVIDSRFKYLKELEYENHRHAAEILQNEYKPALEKLQQLIENIA